MTGRSGVTLRDVIGCENEAVKGDRMRREEVGYRYAFASKKSRQAATEEGWNL